MSSYRLHDDGYAGLKKIIHGRKWVGRVVRHADGGFLGKIGKTFAHEDTEVRAFEAVVAKHLGSSPRWR